MPSSNSGGAKQWASAAYTASAAGSSSETATLPSGQTGRPSILRVSGSVSGEVVLTYGNAAQIIAPVNPNAQYTDIQIPASAFPAPTGSVTMTLTADGAGVIRALIGFQ